MKTASGILLYRKYENDLEVLIVHPSGNYNRKAPWGIPKGQPDPGETLDETARRETREETGIDFEGELFSLGYIDYKKSKKRVHAFAAEAEKTLAPRIASWEIDKAEFLSLDEARRLIHPDQAEFLDRLLEHLKQGK